MDQAQWYELPKKSRRDDYAPPPPPPPQEILDLVRICNCAKRYAKGELVWLGWQPCSANEICSRPNMLGFGSHLLACTGIGAATLLLHLPANDSTRSVDRRSGPAERPIRRTPSGGNHPTV